MEELPFSISDKALEEVKGIIAQKNIPSNYGIRIGIKGGGCSGVSFVFGFDKANENDKVYSFAQLPIYIDKRHLMYIVGLQIDYEASNKYVGFTFINPDSAFSNS